MFASIASLVMLTLFGQGHIAKPPIDSFSGASAPVHIHKFSATGPTGLSPSQIKNAYKLPATGGAGETVAIVDAYASNTVASDLNTFSSKFGLPQCTVTNKCFQQVPMNSHVQVNTGWALEEALDVEWAHAIAPQATIMLVEARSASGTDLLSAINYARTKPGVTQVSMSWGGGEFYGEQTYDTDFISTTGIHFFASAGDSGSSVDWPAVSPNVISVGGTTLNLNQNGSVASELAWSGSGGGVSAYEPEPAYQTPLITNTNGRRAVPDVSYDADPATGVAVYDSTRYAGQAGWFQVGGTSAGAPQWAAIDALGGTVSSSKLYTDAAGANYATYFRDITSGTNGNCGIICTARTGYDEVTGLGTPLTTKF
jgi:subtilase family serine protease